jgi:glycosyltransferase involved in cell wall biosynthesis
MVIAVNTRLLLQNRLEGIGWFMHENLRRITARHPEHNFLFLFDRPFSSEFVYGDNVLPLVVPPPTRHPVLWYLWFERILPGILKKHGAEIYVGPDGFMPLRSEIPCHITIHDINFHHRPGDLPRITRVYYQRYFKRFANRSQRIATVSVYSKNDISNSYGIDPDKIDVVYNGVNEIYSPLSPEEAERYRAMNTSGRPYFIFVGAMHPRKNLAGLLQAYDRFREMTGLDYRLVIVGEKMFLTAAMDRVLREMKFREEIIFYGRLSPEELRKALGASAGMTFIPLFEGFGIPLLEAMRCGVPVLASNVTSLPEIAGDAAVYVNPLDLEEIALGMKQLAEDEALRARLIKNGAVRSREFSWEKTSDLYWDSICRTLDTC